MFAPCSITLLVFQNMNCCLVMAGQLFDPPLLASRALTQEPLYGLISAIDLKIMKPRRNEEHEAKNAKSEVVLALLRGLPSSSSLLRGEISFS
jgi:hypothetical protein